MDAMFTGFLEHQLHTGMALAARSSLLTLRPTEGTPPVRYEARFACRGLVRGPGDDIVEAEGFAVSIWFPSDYLRRANAIEVVSWLGPRNVWHPNIGPGPDGHLYICVGRVEPATPLVELLMRTFEVITYQRVTMHEGDALDRDACVWARGHTDRLPIDPRTILGAVVASQRPPAREACP